MNCGNAIRLIEKLDQITQGSIELTISEQVDFQTLLQAGYFADITIQTVDLAEITKKRSDLVNLQSRSITLREEVSRLKDNKSLIRSAEEKADLGRKEQELEENSNQEKKIRTEILELSAKASNARSSVRVGSNVYILTFKARELMEEIYARFNRVKDMELTALEREIQLLQSLFESNAQKAFRILKLISSKFRSVEEINLRSAAVGLSLRPESPESVAHAFSTIMDLLIISGGEDLAQNRVYIAECLVNNVDVLTPENVRSMIAHFLQIYRRCITKLHIRNDAINCALLLHPSSMSIEQQEKTLDDGANLAKAHILDLLETQIPIAPFILLLLSNGNDAEKVARFDTLFPQLHQAGVSTEDSAFAAAVLAISSDNIEMLLNRYSTAKTYFGQITDLLMVLPAAILSLVSTDIEETWDSLRIASAAISKAKMALGGLENLSLAAKLLLFSSLVAQQERKSGKEVESLKIIPTDAYIPPTLHILAFSTLPIVMNAFTTIHTQTFHQTAVTDYHHHPVHFHHRYYHG